MSISHKRLKKDIRSLIKIKCDLKMLSENELTFVLKGPKDSFYESGKWKIRMRIPKEYPFKSPSIGFIDKIFHPNVDEMSGTICMDVLNQEWTPIYRLINIYETFLPQLLTYPNPDDPLNSGAANLMKNNLTKFKNFVCQYITKHKTY